ncbi:MAG: hypothetical protein WC384_19030 [Prolixibacteraceae bacterium]|jgi:hypothetical protein
MEDWIKPMIAFVSGGAAWEGFKFLYPEIRREIDNYNKAKNQLYENLDPILKASDELYGKIVSLMKEDFATFTNEMHSIAEDVEQNKKYIYYLFSQFWAQLENLRIKSHYFSIARIKKGNELLRFIETYESREFRILDRSIQRIIGEALLEESGTTFKVMSLNQFVNKLQDQNSNIYKWNVLLENKLKATSDKEIRQKIIIFGVLVAILIDHFDPNHKIVRKREIYLNKLSEKSRNIIRRNLLGHYLKFAKNKEAYY